MILISILDWLISEKDISDRKDQYTSNEGMWTKRIKTVYQQNVEASSVLGV